MSDIEIDSISGLVVMSGTNAKELPALLSNPSKDPPEHNDRLYYVDDYHTDYIDDYHGVTSHSESVTHQPYWRITKDKDMEPAEPGYPGLLVSL